MSLLEMVGLGTPKDAVVIDIGSAYTKVGIANEPVPRRILRSEVHLLQDNSSVSVPVLKDVENITDGELLVRLKKFLHLIYFQHLLVNPRERRVIILESLFFPVRLKVVLSKVLFEYFDVPSVLFAPSNLFALFPVGISTALVVDCGYSECTVVPVYEQATLLTATEALPTAGKLVHTSLNEKLRSSRSEADSPLPETVLEEIKVQLGFVGRYPKPVSDVPAINFPVAFKEILPIDIKTRDTCYDTLFEPDDENQSIPSIILDSILKCPVDCRRKLIENILLIGGTTMAPGFQHRLMYEMKELMNTVYKDKLALKTVKFIRLPVKANYISWLGGSIYGALDSLGDESVSREQYKRNIPIPDWSTYLKVLVNPLEKGKETNESPKRMWSKRPSLQQSVSTSPLHTDAATLPSRKMSAS